MVHPLHRARSAPRERIDVTHDYAVCAWARHFNVSEKHVKEAVAAVGNEAERVRDHLRRATIPSAPSSERPSGA